jgi:hypothetical protein
MGTIGGCSLSTADGDVTAAFAGESDMVFCCAFVVSARPDEVWGTMEEAGEEGVAAVAVAAKAVDAAGAAPPNSNAACSPMVLLLSHGE